MSTKQNKPIVFAEGGSTDTSAQTPSNGTQGDLERLKGVIKIGKIIPRRPAQNYCVYLGPGARIDTELPFSKFFDKDHTIAGWYMPQYPRGGHGAIFASDGTGAARYFVGQGDYRSGNALYGAISGGLAPGVQPKAGDPVIAVYVGSTSRIYLAPQWQSGQWVHLAVVRSSNVITCYLNGSKLQPVSVKTNSVPVTQPNGTVKQVVSSKTISPTSDLSIPTINAADLGNLILGRVRHPLLTAYAQAYGLLDDVAVFDHAMTQAEITNLVTKKRLSGYENGLVAGWGFDTPVAGTLLPAKLAGSLDEQSVDPNLKISADRNSTADRWILDNPFVIAATTPIVKFPFPSGQVCKVIQGYCNPVSSHNGDQAAFCYDLSRPSEPSVRASEGGYVLRYKRKAPNPEKRNEANTIYLYNEPYGHIVSYMHLAYDSLTNAVVDGDPDSADPTQWVEVWPTKQRFVYSGTELAQDGPYAQHLHTGAKEMLVEGLSVQEAQNTTPMAYKEIQVLSPGDSDWHNILGCYIPKEGDQIRAL